MKIDYRNTSPLRYPGGKSRLTNLIEDIILLNNLEGGTFYELYAGGAAVSLNLLLSGICQKIYLNDYDFHIYAFWHSILNDTEKFLKLLNDTEVTRDTWIIQKKIHKTPADYSLLEVGYSTFFLNRTNRSGIIHRSGPIGGHDQTGKYKIDVRYNKRTLSSRIEKIASFQSRIEIQNKQTSELLNEIFSGTSEKTFVFLDPPYYFQGERLYYSHYTEADHIKLRDVLVRNRNSSWFLTYDQSERINQLYSNFRKSNQVMSYSLQEKRNSKEIFIFSDDLYVPKTYKRGTKPQKIVLAK